MESLEIGQATIEIGRKRRQCQAQRGHPFTKLQNVKTPGASLYFADVSLFKAQLSSERGL